MYVIKKVRC